MEPHLCKVRFQQIFAGRDIRHVFLGVESLDELLRQPHVGQMAPESSASLIAVSLHHKLTSSHSKLKQECAASVAMSQASKRCGTRLVLGPAPFRARETGKEGLKVRWTALAPVAHNESIMDQWCSTIAWPSCNAPNKSRLSVSQQITWVPDIGGGAEVVRSVAIGMLSGDLPRPRLC